MSSKLKSPKQPPTKNSASKPNIHNNNHKRFITTSSSSFITTGVRLRKQRAQANDFAYDLSKDEHHFMDYFESPMKTVPAGERELLKSGQREAYLQVRYEHLPERKYNYPEATSWRIGWFHNQQTGVA